jgi:hypothetical protein
MGSRVIPKFATPEHRRRVSGGVGGGSSESEKEEVGGGSSSGGNVNKERSGGGSGAKSSGVKMSPTAPKMSPRAGSIGSGSGGGLTSPRRSFVTAT